jgi:hypothetical protein
MNELKTSEHWLELQAKLKSQYPELTESDLEYQEPLGEDMLRMVEYKLGMTKEEMQRIIEGL